MTSELAKVTSKGQVTIPKRIREEMEIRKADRLLFTVAAGKLVVTPVRRQKLQDLFGALPATRDFPGRDAIRDEVRKQLGERIAQGDK